MRVSCHADSLLVQCAVRPSTSLDAAGSRDPTVLGPLTIKLIAIPEQGWPRLAVAAEAGEPVPAPLVHGFMVGMASLGMTFLGSLLEPEVSGERVFQHLLLSAFGYLGPAAVAATVGGNLVDTPDPIEVRARYAASASLPIAASGVFNLIPLWWLTPIWLLIAGALAARSAFVGGADYLGLEGASQKQAALRAIGPAFAVAAIATLIRAVGF